MTNLQSKPLIELNLDTREITITNNIKYIDIDKNIANIFLQIYREDNAGLKAYLTKEELDSFVGKMFLIKPVTNNFTEITGINTEEFVSDNGGGVLRFIIPTEYTNRNGIVKCEIHISKNDELLASDRFVYNVKQSLVTQFNNSLLEDSDFPVLQQLISEIQKASNIDDTRISETTTYSSYKIDSQIKEIENEKATKQEVDVERKRIDNFTSLAEGSTTGDAELIDARISDDGIARANLGENIRTNLSYIKNNIAGNTDLYYTGEKPMVLMLKNGKLNATTGVEEADNIAGITNLIQFAHNEEFTCSVQSAYFDIFVYDSNGSFEKKISYQSNDSVQITFDENKLYRFQITPSNWTTVINNYNYTNYIINAKLKIDSKIVDIKVDKLKEQIIVGKEKLTFEWKYGKFNTDTGEFEDATDCIRTDKLTFRDNETITFGCITDANYYYFIEEYDTVNNTNKCIFNTKKTGSFIVKPNCQYVFAVWYGGTDFSDFYLLYDIECTLTPGVINESLVQEIVDNKADTLKDAIIAGKEKLTFEWQYGKFNTDTGEFEDATNYIRTDKLTFRDNETITFGCIRDTKFYYFIEEYDTVNGTNKCIVNTKKTGSFVTKPNCQYVFAVWYGATDFSEFYPLYLIESTITLESIKKLQAEVEQLQVGNVKDNVHLDFPDNLYIKKGDTLEIFKYGTYYTDKPYLENEYNIRIVNIDQYVKNYSHKIVITCPSDYSNDTLRNSWDLPMIQLLNKYGEVVESKRFTIHVVGTPTKALNVCYFGDSWTGMAYRTQKTAELIAGTNIKLLGKFSGSGDGNKFTGTGGYAWDNYVDDPSTLPSGYPNNYLWDSSTNDINFTKFMNDNCNGENIDVAVVLLGWNDKENGAFASGFSMDKIKNKCKYFIEKLHSEYPNCKIILESYTYGYPFYRSSYSNTMPQVLHNKYVYELNNLYKDIASQYSYVEFLSLSCHADVFYNMPMAEMTANKYNTETIKYCNDDAHLAPEGFYQCAEAETNILMYYAK